MTATETPGRPETAGDLLAATGRHASGKRTVAASQASTPNGCMRPPRARPRQAGPADPPTEAEVRTAIRAALDDSSDIDIGVWVHDLARPLDPDGGVLWADLRPSEAEVLSDLIEAVYREADAIEAEAVTRITELLVYAALEFARRHPGAPRAAREAVTA